MNIWTQWPPHILVSLAWCESKSGPGCRHLYLGLFCVSHSSQGSLLRSLAQARCTVNTYRDLESRQGTGRQNGNHRVTLWHIIGIFFKCPYSLFKRAANTIQISNKGCSGKKGMFISWFISDMYRWHTGCTGPVWWWRNSAACASGQMVSAVDTHCETHT